MNRMVKPEPPAQTTKVRLVGIARLEVPTIIRRACSNPDLYNTRLEVLLPEFCRRATGPAADLAWR